MISYKARVVRVESTARVHCFRMIFLATSALEKLQLITPIERKQ